MAPTNNFDFLIARYLNIVFSLSGPFNISFLPIFYYYYIFLEYSVGKFFEDARQATRCILDSGRVPIVAGGTGLYLRWYVPMNPFVGWSLKKLFLLFQLKGWMDTQSVCWALHHKLISCKGLCTLQFIVDMILAPWNNLFKINYNLSNLSGSVRGFCGLLISYMLNWKHQRISLL